MKNYIWVFLFLGLSACTTSQKINFDKLKNDDRIYTGKVAITLNGKTNKDVACDLFLSVDLNPVTRISADGFYYFKSTRSSVNWGKIACLYTIGNEKSWVYHSFDLKKQKRADENTVVTSFGKMTISWKFDDEQLQKPATKFANDNSDRIENIGQFKVESTSNQEEQKTYLFEKFPELKDPKYKFVEKIFKQDDD